MWSKTREYQPALLFLATSLDFVGTIFNLVGYSALSPSLLATIIEFEGAAIWAVAIFAMLVTFLGDLDYVYRLPDNYYLLLVAYKNSGVMVHCVRFQSAREVSVEATLLSGFMTALNSLFGEALQSTGQIERVAAPDASLLMCTGRWVTAAIAGDNTPAVLARALRRYTHAFEERFADLLERQSPALNEFDGAVDLIPQVFPFLKVLRENAE
jgi:hypothetical protein